jgi:beta-lactam-binding protein with PASTA domain
MFKFIFSKAFLINILLAIVFAVLVIWGIFKFIDSYTHHGETISVPPLEGLTIKEVKTVLEEKKLRYTILDSIYVPEAEKGVVLDQNPRMDDLVKENRTIYITVSKVVPPKIMMPDVVDMSLRLAIAKLESYGLKVETKHTPSECVNCVLMQEIKGKEIKANTPINKGSIIVLTIGSGTSNEKVLVPYLINLTQEEAKQKLMEASLNIGLPYFSENCKCETKSDTLMAKIYKQEPIHNRNVAVNMGSEIDIYLTCDTSMIKYDLTLANDTTELDSSNVEND